MERQMKNWKLMVSFFYLFLFFFILVWRSETAADAEGNEPCGPWNSPKLAKSSKAEQVWAASRSTKKCHLFREW